MEARYLRCASLVRALFILASVVLLSPVDFAVGQFTRTGAVRHVRQYEAHGENFVVMASSPDWAKTVVEAAERYRRDLAVHWLGRELPTWPERCPIHVVAAPDMPASGETKFSPTPYGVGGWRMVVNGSPERVLDSVLPHEISHTVLATHFAKYAHQNRFVPRWADEGACTTVEHESEKRKHRYHLHQFLKTGRGLAFNRMFVLKDYPSDILPLYAQGHSAVQFLLDQSDPREFIRFLEQGMESGNWETALKDHYAYPTIGQFQRQWNQWLFQGSPKDLMAFAPKLQQEQSNGSPLNMGASPSEDQIADNLRPNSTNVESSWYKRRYDEFSGQGATLTKVGMAGKQVAIPNGQNIAGEILPAVDRSMTRRSAPESARLRVLEIGNSIPLHMEQLSQDSRPYQMLPDTLPMQHRAVPQSVIAGGRTVPIPQ